MIIEEFNDDDPFEYSNMPALLNVPSPLFLSHSDPPFIYQYVGDQIRIVQVLGGNPLNDAVNKDMRERLNFVDSKDQIESISKVDAETVEAKYESQDVFEEAVADNVAEDRENDSRPADETTASGIASETIKEETVEIKYKDESDKTQPLTVEIKDDVQNETIEITIPVKIEENYMSERKDTLPVAKEETTSLDTSPNENESSDSDDEASFGTPEDSPKSKRKSPRGRYGKGKAPPPPTKNEGESNEEKLDKTGNFASLTTSQESLVEIVNTLPSANFKDNNNLVVNPIAEKKRRHKSKSPGRIPRSGGTTIGKLLQIPGKLAFWQKNDKQKGDNISTSSEDHSKRSSTYEKTEDFQSCSELNRIIPLIDVDSNNERDQSEDHFSFKDASDVENEVISHDIMEKSDALQKLIEAKRQSHPEYKYTNVEDEIPTTSKSTDV